MPPGHHSDHSVGALADKSSRNVVKSSKNPAICFWGEKPSWLNEDAQVALAAKYLQAANLTNVVSMASRKTDRITLFFLSLWEGIRPPL